MKRLLLNNILLFISISLFTRGFLLMRLEINRTTRPCLNNDYINQSEVESRCLPSSSPQFIYDKIVIMIIDALRYDFARFKTDLVDPLPFQNKMPVFYDLREKHGCTKARLWRFWADAPTTTMQRIKGLTTGSLPTFIDLSKNFASSEITEDNIMDQFIASGKNITFMGDDTWMNLFPGRFNKAFPYPSFDVKDLHLVDNGVIRHLVPEIRSTDWQMIIAHFLGVDHCGHRYGPFHPEMPLKLEQMSEIVRQVTETIDDSTLLLVMGDHGMTPTGDHGGETFNEVNAALFAYSTAGGFKECHDDDLEDPIVDQVDIVPTISFLMGTAVPFANLGVLIQDMLPEKPLHAGKYMSTNDNRTTEAIFFNAMQVHEYIVAYQEVSKSLPQATYKNLTRDFTELEKLYYDGTIFHEKDILLQKLVKYIKSARQMCREVWAKFDIISMLAGLTLCISLLALNINLKDLNLKNKLKKAVYIVLFLASISIYWTFFVNSAVNLIFCLLVCCVSFIILSIVGAFSLWEHYEGKWLWDIVFPTFLLLMYAVSFTTNSFILNEDITTLYILLSAIVGMTLSVLHGYKHSCDEEKSQIKTDDGYLEIPQKISSSDGYKPSSRLTHRKKHLKTDSVSKSSQNEKKPVVNRDQSLLILLALGAMLCARLAIFLRYCRAEQFWCFETESNSNATESQSSSGYDNNKVMLSCVGLIASVWLPMYTLKKSGNLRNSWAMNTFIPRRFFPICIFFIILSWIILLLPAQDISTFPSYYITFSPRVAYSIIAIFSVIHWISPIYATILYPDGRGNYVEKKNSFARIFNIMRYELDRNSNSSKKLSGESVGYPSPIAFGLYTVLTAAVISSLLPMIMLFSMLVGPERSTSILLWMICSVIVLEMTSVLMRQKKTFYVPWSSVVLWGLISSFWWFATGHQASISSIQWDAAFVGFHGSHSTNIIPGLLVLLNTFSIQVLSTASLPLLMLWRCMKGRWCSDKQCQDEVNELLFYKDQDKFFSVMKDLFLKYYCFYIAKIVGCMVCTCLHRRHLMVWWIFAPRYMFEGVSLIVVMVSCLFTYIHICHVGRKLASWLRSIENSQE